MSGHSKWANIKRKKEANDKVKGATFAKLSRAITLTVLEGGGITDPEKNVRLRLAIEKAKSFNMPKDVIARAVEKGAGPNKDALKEVVYEAFAQNGVSLIITAATDNSNRTHAELRTVLERNGGKMGTQGAVAYNFQKCGVAVFENADEAKIFEFADKIGELDIEEEGTTTTVYFPFENLGKVHDALQGLVASAIETEYKPQTTVQLSKDEEDAVFHLIELVEDMDDVQAVYSNI
jgi:YebC/PmpR family DNA-binding regulatory protein